jgi:hypothetical protein
MKYKRSIWNNGLPLGWLPVSLGSFGCGAVVKWMEVGLNPLVDPFFRFSIEALRAQDPPPLEVETDISVVKDIIAEQISVVPAGILFHMSRCGSTLVLNALKAADRIVGLSEAQPINKALELARSNSTYWARLGAVLLPGLTSVFSHYRGEPAQSVIIKCVVPDIASLRVVRTMWPSTPCFVLVRNPIEVIVSNLEIPPPWLSTWPNKSFTAAFGLPPAQVSNAVDYCAWVIGRFCEIAFDLIDCECTVIDYEELDLRAIQQVANSCGLCFSSNAEVLLGRSLAMYSKAPDRLYADDRDRKRRRSTDVINRSAEKWCLDPYQRLKEQRPVRSTDGFRIVH